MDKVRFTDCFAEDYALLRDAAASVDLGVPVPSCPGWTMGNLVTHVGQVYLHKTTVMRTGEWPRPWPPAELEHEPPLALLGRAYGELTAEFAARDADEAVPTWYEPEETVGFWLRRMAHETVIHRIDAELAAGLPSARVPDDLALDGIDEVLIRFLAYFSPEGVAEGHVRHLPGADGTAAIVVSSAGRNWTVRPSSSDEVTAEPGAARDPMVVVSAAPDPMLRWLWGRTTDDAVPGRTRNDLITGRTGNGAVTVTGDPAWAGYLRQLLIATTQ
jgi:uncharacterized protein (TIGR03083 family)